MEIEVFSDVVCPWCYIGKRRLEQALAEFDGEVTVRYRPFQLDPGTPAVARPLMEWLAPKFGGAERAREITAHTTEVAAADGIDMRFGDALIANTFDAHRLIWYVTEMKPEFAADVVEALHRAHFTNGEDIASRSVLTAAAVEAGFDDEEVRAFLGSPIGNDEVRELIDDARAKGISSVPTFVLAGKYMVSGAREPQVLLEALREVERLESSQH